MAVTGLPPYNGTLTTEYSLRCVCARRYLVFTGMGRIVGDADVRAKLRAEEMKATFVDSPGLNSRLKLYSRPSRIAQKNYSLMIVFADSFRLNNLAQPWRLLLTTLLTEGEDMKTRNTITKLITITMTVAAMAVIGSICWTTEAQHTRLIFATDQGIYGFVHGQTARFSVAYPSTTEVGTEPVRAQVTLYDAQGNEVARSREVEVPPGQFRIFNFDRDDLQLAGEPGTGRLQLRAGIQVVLMDGSVRHVKLPVSREIVDNRTGASSGGSYYTGTVSVHGDGFGGGGD